MMTDDLRKQYEALFNSCVTKPDELPAVKHFVNLVFAHMTRYDAVALSLASGGTPPRKAMPWYVIGVIHGLESDFDFGTHLHNGDPLSARTVHVPRGRPPPPAQPPFSWEVSAADALRFDQFTSWDDWSAAGICYKIEGYNGFGYRREGINSPYLWSKSNHYERGKYTSDSHYDPDAVSSQVGAMTAIHQMVSDRLIAIPTTAISAKGIGVS